MTLTVSATGPQALVQDLGRPGHARIGVTRSGAADREALRLGNRLLGNPESAAGIEALLGGLALTTDTSVVVALTGAIGPAKIDGRPIPHGEAVALPRGATLTLGRPVQGLRTYVLVHGGLATPLVLGSRSTDTLSGIGPDPLVPGSTLTVGDATTDITDAQAPPRLPRGELTLRVTAGPRDDWFTHDALASLSTRRWQVSGRTDRIGTRLGGPALDRLDDRELPSEGCVRGSIQVSSDGLPTIFGPDHPVTGGYPVIACVHEHDCDLLAQAVPGSYVRFAPS